MIDSLLRKVPAGLHKKLHRKSFGYAKRRAYADWCARIDPTKEPLIVYQMGKVGSSTVCRTLHQFQTTHNIFQVHVLTWDWIHRVEEQYRQASADHGRTMLDEHILTSRWVRTCMDRNPAQKWKVIALVRDPVARNVSAFFQAFPVYFSKLSKKNGDGNITALETQELVSLFLKEFGQDRHDLPLEWFDLHFKPAFGLDVFKEPFDQAAGYKIYHGDQCDLLLMRMEDLKACMQPALEAFAGLKIDGLARANAAADKDYAQQYQDFHAQLRLPQSYLDRLYDSDFAKYFYTQEQLENFRQKWSAN